ncbi:PTS sugar transporter subunit IIC [Mediterraneibacter sp. NSJ-55]|uniref:PTS sugar transporter subunit IIC n=1 Tax=Mediterraneibacter hominis TaxID=2763054 RepID=A0A923RR91_9FIRM|nr:PTS transporter subunit IIC [Mediterraneibacter hominis]MBC5690331.1 PTS sugar transporter subunit IIC [Mediterraneibacter hominis]
MQILIDIGNAVNNVMGIFGSTIIVPIIIFIISMCMRVGVKKSFQGAIYMAVGLTLFNAVLGILMNAITPYVTAMADTVGISLPYIDIGWQGASVVVYSNTLGYIYLVLGLGLNLLLFGLKLVDTFQPTDIWNYYQFVFWAVIVQFTTGSFALGVAAAVMCNLVVLLIADIIAPSLQEFNGYDNLTLTSVPSGGAPFAMIVRWIVMKLKIKTKPVSAESLQNRFGFWGEPLIIGLIVGILITILGSLTGLTEASTWSGILTTAITIAGVMVIYPSVSGLFVKGLIPLSQSMQARAQTGKSNRKYFHVAMDPAVFFGNGDNMAAALILIPIVFFTSLIMPGNKILMLADIPAMAFMTAGLICVFRGDILMTIISGTIWFNIANVLNSDVCAAFTKAAESAGVASQMDSVANAFSQGLGIAAWTVGTNPVLYLVYKAFSAEGAMRIIGVILVVAVFLLIYLSFRKNKKKWWMAAGASEEYLAERGYIE